jgi:hypothetical protein
VDHHFRLFVLQHAPDMLGSREIEFRAARHQGFLAADFLQAPNDILPEKS